VNDSLAISKDASTMKYLQKGQVADKKAIAALKADYVKNWNAIKALKLKQSEDVSKLSAARKALLKDAADLGDL
jgi:hypothetical protein